MATLIPAFSECKHRMTPGERRLAERLIKKNEDDILLWWDVPIGPKQTRPDFVLLHPQRGALILEVKDWKLETIQKVRREYFEIRDANSGQRKVVINPLQQAHHCALQVVNALSRDVKLLQSHGPYQGKLAFPWGHGVALTNITRSRFEAAGLGEVIPPHLAICQDEMYESVDADAFQERLWAMFPHAFGGRLTDEQLGRVRWILFPEIRVPEQRSLFQDADPQAQAESNADAQWPELMQVMDLLQEQLARSLGEGHRVIHGVAGSGKTMLLQYRAEHLARSRTADDAPILVVCYNEPLAVFLAHVFTCKGLQDHVHAVHFHKWVRSQLVDHDQLPEYAQRWPVEKKMEEYVRCCIRAVAQGHIPSGQYHAVLIDEGHDFEPDWLRLLTQMVDPVAQQLLLLYDDAQSIYRRGARLDFSLKSVGIQAQGRTTILKTNYRNTRQILQLAHQVAGDILRAQDSPDEDHIPLLAPVSCGRDGPPPIVIDLPTLPERASRVAELLADQHAQGHAWNEMAVLCRDWNTMHACSRVFLQRGLPHTVRKKSGDFKPQDNTIKVMTMHASKGLEWPVVAILAGGTDELGQEEREQESKLSYVAATRSTSRLFI